MELYAESGMLLVLDRHDLAFTARRIRPRDDFEFIRQGVWLNHQTMITRGNHRIRDAGKNCFAVVMDLVGFTMHQSISSNNLTAGCCPDGLVAQANTKNWNLAMEVFDALDRDAGFLGSARAWRDNQMRGGEILNLFDRYLIVANDLEVNLIVDFTNALSEVVGERVVVVDDYNHDGSALLSVRKRKARSNLRPSQC